MSVKAECGVLFKLNGYPAYEFTTFQFDVEQFVIVDWPINTVLKANRWSNKVYHKGQIIPDSTLISAPSYSINNVVESPVTPKKTPKVIN